MELEPSDQPVIEWPARPTCHDRDPFAQRFEPTAWRPKGVKLHPENDNVPVFRTCSYCGSMHPEDLIAVLNAGARLGGSDWKYSWPHKFYVHDIPNPNVGNPVSRSRRSLGVGIEPSASDRQQYQEWKQFDTPHGKRWEGKQWEPDGPTTHGKWYNEHLQDLNPDAFAELAALLHKHAGILFEMKDGKLHYAAPSRGYQA